MSYSDGAPAGPLAAPFWEMLTLLAQEPGMEWLEWALAGQADPFSHRSRGAERRAAAVVHLGSSWQSRERGAAGAGEYGLCSVGGSPACAAVAAAQCLPHPP